MKYVDEFRHPELIRRLLEEIHALAAGVRTFRIMEICGGHTHAIFRFGLHDLLPSNVELIHGPGCPVCVLSRGRMDGGLKLAEDANVILTVFGDMMRVPGTNGSPLESKSRGTDIRFVYSPLDALQLAQQNPDRKVIFFAIGFETTAPATALTLLKAQSLGLKNFRVYCNHVRIIPAMQAILQSPDMRLDAFIGPGHVSTVIGCKPYEFVASEFGCPIVVSGFEPADILQSLLMILRQLNKNEARVENQYERAVTWEGNRAALAVMQQCFEIRPDFEWRGMGSIPESAYRIHSEFAAWDAEQESPPPLLTVIDPAPTQCGAVLQGLLKPDQCQLFGKECSPEFPLGALMVSSEGACAAHYKYGRGKLLAAQQ